MIRQFGYASLIAADGSADQAWSLAARSPAALRDLLGAMPLIRDPALRASLYPRIEPLLRGLPANLASAHQGKGSTGRYVRKEGVKAPEGKLALELGGDGPEGIIRRAAMNALTYVRGQEVPTFRALARFVRDNVDRHAAVLALQKVPAAYWPAEEAGPLLESLIAYVRQVPVADRTSPAAVDALQLGDSLAALLPADRRGRSARSSRGWASG